MRYKIIKAGLRLGGRALEVGETFSTEYDLPPAFTSFVEVDKKKPVAPAAVTNPAKGALPPAKPSTPPSAPSGAPSGESDKGEGEG